MKVWESPMLRIDFDDETKLLAQTWKGFGSSQSFREGIEKTLQIFIQKKGAFLLVDSSAGAIVKKEDTDYAAQLAVQFAKNGIKAQAFVIPANAFVKASVNNFTNNTSGYPIQYFGEVQKAKEWLLSQK